MEVQSLVLDRAELVILSACETGLGDTASGEGVLGLQRSFHIAGAQNVISSLWKVQDDATQYMMNEFYKNALEGRMSYAEALRQAQLKMIHDYSPQGAWDTRDVVDLSEEANEFDKKNDAVLPASREAGRRLAPRYWASFTIANQSF